MGHVRKFLKRLGLQVPTILNLTEGPVSYVISKNFYVTFMENNGHKKYISFLHCFSPIILLQP